MIQVFQKNETQRPIRLGWGTTLILAIIALAFVVELALAAPGNDFILLLGSRAGIGNNVMLLQLGALPNSGGLHGQYWRLLTSGILHRNVVHIVTNASCLLWLGLIVERRIGPGRLLMLFVVASAAGGLAVLIKDQFLLSSGTTVGASGGVFGFMGAALVLVQRVAPAYSAVRIVLPD